MCWVIAALDPTYRLHVEGAVSLVRALGHDGLSSPLRVLGRSEAVRSP